MYKKNDILISIIYLLYQDGCVIFFMWEQSRLCVMENNVDVQHDIWMILQSSQSRCGLGLKDVVHQHQNNRRGVIGKNAPPPDLNSSDALLLDFRAHHRL